ncbi:hypothetical protein Syun_002783 [Stephania yunnanensis]|uniref:Uncharacterized protein n=1 Tax=Stephania yunnanensis TaxID=152371 RepID=A0AAP0LH51_9MAGN
MEGVHVELMSEFRLIFDQKKSDTCTDPSCSNAKPHSHRTRYPFRYLPQMMQMMQKSNGSSGMGISEANINIVNNEEDEIERGKTTYVRGHWKPAEDANLTELIKVVQSAGPQDQLEALHPRRGKQTGGSPRKIWEQMGDDSQAV